ncbi:GIY-YIG nuclease family protein [Amniculibacterium aquaticum]|uniref:GIY-YIG nuclease family protein n=1 Tax=Amniculibacterium aquaticum TaxID=2479858 RepID=UPI000F5A16B3|nr:GIY-YIG nuclease family protein [Amniculibacterium aquaticum]
MFLVYILFSQTLGKFYIGMTSDIEKRMQKHLENHDGFTSKAKDWKIVFTQEFDDKSSALKREAQIKNWKSKKMILNLISS